MIKSLKIAAFFVFCTALSLKAQTADTNRTSPKKPTFKSGPGTTGKDTITDAGVAVSPSSLYFRVKPGKTETQYLTITNDTRKNEKFKISFADYTIDKAGKSTQLAPGQFADYGLSKFIVASPSLVDLKPGERKKVAITIAMPETDEAYRSAWTNMMVDRVNERQYLTPPKGNDNAMQMGVIPTFGFGVWVYQNPPNVKINKVEITSFNFAYNDTSQFVTLKVKNTGDGMGFCKSYVELNNLNTGKIEKHFLKQFVVFPGVERTLEITVPGKLTKGKYSVLGVLDFGSKETLEVAEQEITVVK